MKRFLSAASRTKTASQSNNIPRRFPIPSISFSGAGFLGVYHAGVYACLLKHNHVLQPLERLSPDSAKAAPILTGVSAGAIIAAAISAGVTPDAAMNVVLQVAERTRTQGGLLDVLRPGFSLLDQLDDLLVLEMQKALGGSGDQASPYDYDNELLMNRIQNGKLLHIGLTDRKKFDISNTRADLKAYVYADTYRDIKDICSASILSSYIPLGTGPAIWDWSAENIAVKVAWETVKDMEQEGFLKHGISRTNVLEGVSQKHSIKQETESESDSDSSDDKDGVEDTLRYLDGGLANLCPEIDSRTLIVAPINGIYSHPYIAPLAPNIEEDSILERWKVVKHIEISDRVKIGLNTQNVVAIYQMARSSSPQVLEQKFRDGYDDAKRYLSDHDLLTVYSA